MFGANERLIYFTPDGTAYELHAPPSRAVLNVTGLGLSSRSFATRRGPYQQGETLISQTLDPREISVTIRERAKERQGYWDLRETLVNLLRENNSSLTNPQPGILRKMYYQDHTVIKRDIEVYLKSDPMMTSPVGVWDELAVQDELVFTAPNPIFYDPELQTETLTSFDSHLVLPFTFPFVLGCFSVSTNITYVGTWEEYPKFIISGPASNITVINESTGKRISVEHTISAGEQIIIDLDYDLKQIYNDCGDDWSGGDPGDLGTFSLQPTPLVTDGINTLTFYTDTYDSGYTQIDIEYYNRYRGI